MASVRFTAFIAEGRPAIARKMTDRKLIRNFVKDTHDRPLASKVHLPCEGSTSDPDEVDRRLDAVDLVEEDTMCSCHVAICRDRLPIVLARPYVVHVCPVKRFW
jgi:hypothetical protein